MQFFLLITVAQMKRAFTLLLKASYQAV